MKFETKVFGKHQDRYEGSGFILEVAIDAWLNGFVNTGRFVKVMGYTKQNDDTVLITVMHIERLRGTQPITPQSATTIDAHFEEPTIDLGDDQEVPCTPA